VLLLATFFGFFAAEFPDDAPLAKFTIDAGVGAGLAQVQAFLTIIIIHFLTMDAGLPIGVKAAIHRKSLRFNWPSLVDSGLWNWFLSSASEP